MVGTLDASHGGQGAAFHHAVPGQGVEPCMPQVDVFRCPKPFQTQTVGDFGSKNQNFSSKNSDSTDSTDSTDSRSRSLSPPRSEFRYSVQVSDPQEPQDPEDSQAPTFAKAGAMSGFKKSMFQIGWSEHGAYPKMAISKG